jgi:zinc/manganese transport system permease protein
MTDILFQSLLLSLVLLGIHAYFGMQIVERGIIFTDIAIAQASAVGLALSLFLYEKPSYTIALVFALFSSLLIALSQRKKDYAEAFIGLLYALGFSSVVLILSKSPHGTEDFMNLIATDILFVPKEEVIKTAFIYSVLGFLLYFRSRFLKGLLKELSFFVLFALTVTSSVKLVGVLIVFSMLVSPALVTKLLGKGLVFAWVYGAVINTVGILLSFKFDFPTGFSLVFLHSLSGILVFLFKVFI